MTASEPQFDELYREVILDHYRSPRNRGELAGATLHLHGMNPVCGDEILLDVQLEGGVMCDLAFRGQGCSISQSSASMMTEAVKGCTPGEAASLGRHFRAMLMEEAPPDPALGDLEALEGVRKFPVRVKCALLAWSTLEDGLKTATEV